MKPGRFSPFRAWALAVVTLFCSVSTAGEPWTVEDVNEYFEHTSSSVNYACVVLDGWKIAFMSHNKGLISAIVITQKSNQHQYDLPETVQRLIELTGIQSPEQLKPSSHQDTSVIIVNSKLFNRMGSDAEEAFGHSPLKGVAYLLSDDYFYLHKILPNGYLHWKTVKKSGVELLMPLAPLELSVVEISGKQEMNTYATEVLARKLGLDGNTAKSSRRETVRNQLGCDAVTYINQKTNIVGARQGEHFYLGDRNTISMLLHSPESNHMLYPAHDNEWPSTQKQEQKEEVREAPARPLTPSEARTAYEQYLRTFGDKKSDN